MGGKKERETERRTVVGLRGADMPAAQVELDYGHKSLNRVVDSRNGEEHFRVAHKTA